MWFTDTNSNYNILKQTTQNRCLLSERNAAHHMCVTDSLTCLDQNIFFFLLLSGNCWLLAALSCLTMHPTLFVKVVPPGQSLSEPYVGIFRFRVSLIKPELERRTSSRLTTGVVHQSLGDTSCFLLTDRGQKFDISQTLKECSADLASYNTATFMMDLIPEPEILNYFILVKSWYQFHPQDCCRWIFRSF